MTWNACRKNKNFLSLNITAVETFKAVSRVLDQVPERLLADILDFLREVQSVKSCNATLTRNFKKFLRKTVVYFIY